jgi:flagellar protein FliL
MSNAIAQKPPEDGDVAPVPPKKNGITLFLIINSVLLAGVLAMLVLKPGHASEAKAAEAPEAPGPSEHGAKPEGKAAANGVGPTVRLADFIIHLRNPEVERYARVSFEIEVGTDLDKERMAGHLPRIRETFIAYLSDQTLEDLRGSEGIKKTKDALFEKLKAIAPDCSARAIYITDLVIQ